jgi:hypothetical protein
LGVTVFCVVIYFFVLRRFLHDIGTFYGRSRR